MTLDSLLLKGLKKDVSPDAALKRRIRSRVLAQTKQPKTAAVLTSMRDALTPKEEVSRVMWGRIASSLHSPVAERFFSVRTLLEPAQELSSRIRERVLARVTPLTQHVTAHAALRPRILKWSAALLLFGLFVRMSPFLFIAPPTVAESAVLLTATEGRMQYSFGDGEWHVLRHGRDFVAQPGMLVKTRGGEASIIGRDDWVVRLAPDTTVQLNDLADSLQPAPEVFPTITLYTGKVWVQGLVPERLRGISVATSYGVVTVNEGSASIAEADAVTRDVAVEVYDRRVVVDRNGERIYLTTGDRTNIWEGNVALIKKIPDAWYQRSWATQNLQRDAVHRHDIAQLQHERRVAAAGILPSSPLYPVKRVAETVDMLLTFGQEARTQKKLHLAQMRLNEAAALIAVGESQADESQQLLAEYRETLLRLTQGPGDGSLTQFLVQQAIAETSAEVAAAMPGDGAYPLKEAILKASVALPDAIVRNEDVQGELLLDGLAVLTRKVENGDEAGVQVVWAELQPYMPSFEDAAIALKPGVHKEAKTLLSFLAASLYEAKARGTEVNPELLDDIAIFLPPPVEPTEVSLTEEEVMEIVQSVREKIFVFNMQQSRINQFLAEMRALEGHPDRGRILRRLAQVLPEGPENFPDRTYKEIVRLRWEKAAEGVL